MNIDETIEAAQADYFWAPSDVQIVDRPEITYSWSVRPQMFFNCVVRVRPTPLPPAELVAEVARRHERRSSRWSLNRFSDTAQVRAALLGHGYEKGHEHHAYVIRPQDYTRVRPSDIVVRRVQTVADLQALYAVRAEVFGREGDSAQLDLAAELAQCTGPRARIARFVAYCGDEPVASGGLTFFEPLDLAFIWAGGVREAFRGRGAYTALLGARMDAARERGVGVLGLYARDSTSGPIVAAHGFERHGHMVHWNRQR